MKIYPLPHMPVVKDLVPDLKHFYAQYAVDQALAEDRHAGRPTRERLQSPRGPRQARRAVGVHPVLLLLDLLPELLVERRPLSRARRSCCRPIAGSSTAATRQTGERLDELEDPFRLYRCHTIMNCTKTCPKGLNPAKAIAEIKKLMVERR